MAQAGQASRLVQTFTDEHGHSDLADAAYVARGEALVQWGAKGDKPTPESVAARCAALEPRFGAGCHVAPNYRPAPLDARVTPRTR